MRRFWDWIETEWYLAALGSRWRQIVWAPVLIPLTIVANFPRTTLLVGLGVTLWWIIR